MKLTHGSTKNIREKGGFKAFDYVIDMVTGECTEDSIDNGKDAYGPGIYTFVAEGALAKSAVDDAMRYAGVNGYVHFLEVDVDENDLMNNLPGDYFGPEIWTEILERFANNRRQKEGYDYSDLDDKLSSIATAMELGEDIDIDAYDEALKSSNADFNSSEVPTEDYDSGWDWQNDVMERYEMCDPCNKMMEEGGPEGLANTAPYQYDDLWSVVKRMWNLVAVNDTGKGYASYNETFIDSVISVAQEHDVELVGAKVNEGIFVVFDPDSISINKVLEVNPSNEKTQEFI